MPYVIAYHLGTSGVRATLHAPDGIPVSASFVAYPTFYPKPQWHEQRPADWWDGVCRATRKLLQKTGAAPKEILAAAVSGHSLAAVPLGAGGELLMDQVPIWSDTRAEGCLDSFFEAVPYLKWYSITGNGDPPACYSVFKLIWMKEHHPELFAKTKKALGSKDYINYMFTGVMATDPSYASGSGVYDLLNWRYCEEFVAVSGIPGDILPEIIPSHEVVGRVTAAAAESTGLAEGTPVACGGVSNSCLALGALGMEENRVYMSLGSSCWLAVNVSKPLIEARFLPFTFAHIEEGRYTSAMSIFAAGSAYLWVRKQLCRDIGNRRDAFSLMDSWAGKAPVGSNGVIFNPSLAGGSTQERSTYIQGAFMGLTLATTREDMIRAAMEGVALNMQLLLEQIELQVGKSDEILMCGQGSRSEMWQKIFAGVFDRTIVKTDMYRDATALGAAAIAARACGLWRDYAPVRAVHTVRSERKPVPEEQAAYRRLISYFSKSRHFLSEFGDAVREDAD
jgi:xylulokinase